MNNLFGAESELLKKKCIREGQECDLLYLIFISTKSPHFP